MALASCEHSYNREENNLASRAERHDRDSERRLALLELNPGRSRGRRLSFHRLLAPRQEWFSKRLAKIIAPLEISAAVRFCFRQQTLALHYFQRKGILQQQPIKPRELRSLEFDAHHGFRLVRQAHAGKPLRLVESAGSQNFV